MDNTKRERLKARFQQAMALFQSGRLADAEPMFRDFLEQVPDNPAALHMLGVIALQTGRPERAKDLIASSIAQFPGDPLAQRNLGFALSLLGQHEEALESYDRAISLKADFANAHFNRGVALNALGRHEGALRAYDEAIRADQHYAEAHNNRANTLNELRRHADALDAADRAIRLSPGFAEAYTNRGVALIGLTQFENALTSLDRATAIDARFWPAYANRGNALGELGRWDESLASYEQAMALNPFYAECDRIIDNARDGALLPGHALLAALAICKWEGIEQRLADIAFRVNHGQSVSPPFPLLLASTQPELQKAAAEIHVRSADIAVAPDVAAHDRIRIGYFSADLHDHATAYLTAELFEKHDRTRFELFAFSFGPKTGDAMQLRLMRAFDHFIDVRNMSDGDVANLARRAGIDIAVDLKGFTLGARHRIFEHRAAPVQVNWLGYPGTMGADFIDYLIADPVVIPPECCTHFTEKIVWLPDTYQSNDTRRAISGHVFTRADAGLPPAGFVFCCFNNCFKILPETFGRWMRILSRVDGSVLWLLEDNASASANLRREAAARGIDATRLVFAGRVPRADHLARQALADLFLDTLPYNAHTTASDALWAGLPVLTLREQTFASRVAASLLTAVELPELITSTGEEFESLAVELAGNPEKLASLKTRLAANRFTAPLFDIRRFTRHIETAYTTMMERCRSGLPPAHISIPAISGNDAI
ncbi:MAG: tetratricopeptide repeat protein [Rhizomicrobium sp.]|jgi:predicted O-linked N-acetylglucosamine transferase (SPINDLY family)